MAKNMQILSSSVGCKLQTKITKNLNNNIPNSDPVAVMNFSNIINFTNGNGIDNAGLLWYDGKTLLPSERYLITLTDTLYTPFGDTLNFDRIKSIVILNVGETDLKFVAKSFSGWCKNTGDYIIVKKHGFFVLTIPDIQALTVTSGSDELEIVNVSSIFNGAFQVGILGSEIDSSSSSSSSSESSASSSSSEMSSSSSESESSLSSVSSSSESSSSINSSSSST